MLINMIKNKNSGISIQFSRSKIEAPKVFLNKKGCVDIDRYSKKNGTSNLKFKGFMTGLLFINKKLSNFYFKQAELLLKKNQDSVFYDPVIGVNKKYLDLIHQSGIWTDFDEIKDKKRVKLILETILKLKRLNYLF